IRFAGGPQQMSIRLAAQLGRAVRTGTPVTAVEHGAERKGSVPFLSVHTAQELFRARHVVLTPPKPVIGRLAFFPPLPPAYDQILQRQPMGSVTKVNAIYDTPFWREAGLNGQVVSDTGPLEI